MTTTTKLTLADLTSRAAARGYGIVRGVTEEDVDRIDHAIIVGNGCPLSDRRAVHRSLDIEESERVRLADQRCVAVPYRIATVGAHVCSRPESDPALKLITIPRWTVVAHIAGSGETMSDVDDVSEPHAMTMTILRPGWH